MRPLVLLAESLDRLRVFQAVIEDLGSGLAALNDAQDATFRHIAYVLNLELDTIAKIGEMLKPVNRVRTRALASLEFSVSPVGELVAVQVFGLEPTGGEQTIAREHVARVAVELLKDRFDNADALGGWLAARNIPSFAWPT
jgi:hypothetical protein